MKRGFSKDTEPIDKSSHTANRHEWITEPIRSWLNGFPLTEEHDHALRRSLRRRIWGLGPFLESIKEDDGNQKPDEWPV